jgi:hypothetical protein
MGFSFVSWREGLGRTHTFIRLIQGLNHVDTLLLLQSEELDGRFLTRDVFVRDSYLWSWLEGLGVRKSEGICPVTVGS